MNRDARFARPGFPVAPQESAGSGLVRGHDARRLESTLGGTDLSRARSFVGRESSPRPWPRTSSLSHVIFERRASR